MSAAVREAVAAFERRRDEIHGEFERAVAQARAERDMRLGLLAAELLGEKPGDAGALRRALEVTTPALPESCAGCAYAMRGACVQLDGRPHAKAAAVRAWLGAPEGVCPGRVRDGRAPRPVSADAAPRSPGGQRTKTTSAKTRKGPTRAS